MQDVLNDFPHLLMSPHHVIIEPDLPKLSSVSQSPAPSGGPGLKLTKHLAERFAIRREPKQQMNVIRHQAVGVDAKMAMGAQPVERCKYLLCQSIARRRLPLGLPGVTARSDGTVLQEATTTVDFGQYHGAIAGFRLAREDNGGWPI